MKFIKVSVLVFLGIIGSVLSISLNCQVSSQLLHLDGDHRNAYRTCVFNNVHLTNYSDQITLSGISHGDTSMVGVQFRNSVVKFFPKELLKAFPRLQVIDLQDQHVDAVYKDNFQGGASFIRTYWAPNNDITELGPNAFSYMGKMYTLYLENNPIEYIHALAFSGLPKLSILFLKGTNMKTLSFESFWYLYDLIWVNFDNANGRSNCMNQEFHTPRGDLQTVQRAMAQKCSSGDPFKTQKCKIHAEDQFKITKYDECEAMNSKLLLTIHDKDEEIKTLKTEIVNC